MTHTPLSENRNHQPKQRALRNRQLNSIYMYLARCRMHLTQTELARLAETDRKTIYNIEKGKIIPNVVTAIRIASILGQPVEDLFKLTRFK